MEETELTSEERRLANFLDFIGDGWGRKSLGAALVETERRVEALREELDGLRRGCDKVFQAPPVEWIDERLSQLREFLQRRTGKSALILRRLLGPIRLEPDEAGYRQGLLRRKELDRHHRASRQLDRSRRPG